MQWAEEPWKRLSREDLFYLNVHCLCFGPSSSRYIVLKVWKYLKGMKVLYLISVFCPILLHCDLYDLLQTVGWDLQVPHRTKCHRHTVVYFILYSVFLSYYGKKLSCCLQDTWSSSVPGMKGLMWQEITARQKSGVQVLCLFVCLCVFFFKYMVTYLNPRCCATTVCDSLDRVSITWWREVCYFTRREHRDKGRPFFFSFLMPIPSQHHKDVCSFHHF